MEKSLKVINLKYFYIVPCVIGCFLPTLSADLIYQIESESTILKILGTTLFLFGISFNVILRGLNLKLLLVSLFLTSFFYIFSISSFLFDSSDSLNHLLRACLATLICYFFLVISKNESKSLLLVITIFLSFIALIGVASILFNFSNGEKFPVLNISSTKSIIFEQNVYGIAMFFLIFICMRYKEISSKKIVKYFIIPLAFFALLFSFYRTVYLCLIVLLFLNSSRKFIHSIIILAFGGLAFIYFGDVELISNILKLEQISNLTGRLEMYKIGWDLFLQSPYIGLSELSIPFYLQYTTFHNLILDTLICGGILGLILLLVTYFLLLRKSDLKFYLPLLLLISPSLLNTFYLFGPNILGFSAAAIIFSHQIDEKKWS